MRKLVNKYMWMLTGALFVPVVVKCVMMWDGGNGAAALGAKLPHYLMLPLIVTGAVALINYLEAKIIVDADGVSPLRRVLMLTISLFLYIHAVTLMIPLTRENLPLISMLVFCGIGVFFVLLGVLMPSLKRNRVAGVLMPSLKRNRVAGVRYSWTLSDPEVWRDSNRIGGRYTIAMGVILLVSAFIPQRREMIFSTFELWAFIVYVAALTLHSRLIAFKKHPPTDNGPGL